MNDICLEFKNFTLGYQGHAAVHHLSGDVQRGSLTAIAGANGSGKSTLLKGRHQRWGRSIGLLPQEPWLALDPTMRVGAQVSEVHRYVKGKTERDSLAATSQNLAEVSLSSAAALYPFQISGGMGQRAAIAMTHAADTELLIADEPTKGLDTALRDSLTARLRHEVGAGRLLLTITHDVAVARSLGGTIGVMLDGKLVEYGTAEALLAAPEHVYTKALLAAEPSQWERRTRSASGNRCLSAGPGKALW
ncbi:putative D,D-dipeptide transport ATP-binding protein DdpD [Agrobacterium sp. DSM 25558]|uniref:ATP-binding cassette domain-containing protein n=1 Tax=Agrobacterium sp. DSM 25558 TaxID=1907665 RepID=UPI0009724AAB|nr:ATP-binding cassette domain-containing protein [Agrobacterium sp. DSM 25558]SCX22264.1 putative D,D-dipeptide transport ATP-binding protein DdpD [Agrobacterium sp. DSM 25558]